MFNAEYKDNRQIFRILDVLLQHAVNNSKHKMGFHESSKEYFSL